MKAIISLVVVVFVCCTHITGYKLQVPEISDEIQNAIELNHLRTRNCEEFTDCVECLSADCMWRKVMDQNFACTVKKEWSLENEYPGGDSCPPDYSFRSNVTTTTTATTTSTTTQSPPTPPSPITDCEIAEMVIHHYPGPCKATITCKNGSTFRVNQCLNTLTFISAFTPS